MIPMLDLFNNKHVSGKMMKKIKKVKKLNLDEALIAVADSSEDNGYKVLNNDINKKLVLQVDKKSNVFMSLDVVKVIIKDELDISEDLMDIAYRFNIVKDMIFVSMKY